MIEIINTTSKLLLAVSLIIVMTGCTGENVDSKKMDDNALKTIDQVPIGKWESLARKKIYFGHQSVGNNILIGIDEISSENSQIRLNVVETREMSSFESPIFAHSSIGKNDYPLTKIDDFVNLINNEVGVNADIAFLKYCFVDITEKSQVEHIFGKYRESIDRVRVKYPNLTIVHFTVPLLQQQKGIAMTVKNFIKKIIGNKNEGFFDESHNIARNEYNKLLINNYGGKEPIFDIAKLESTYPSGKAETFTYEGVEYFALVPEYTDDGGHLNMKGRKYIAEQLLIFLANM